MLQLQKQLAWHNFKRSWIICFGGLDVTLTVYTFRHFFLIFSLLFLPARWVSLIFSFYQMFVSWERRKKRERENKIGRERKEIERGREGINRDKICKIDLRLVIWWTQIVKKSSEHKKFYSTGGHPYKNLVMRSLHCQFWEKPARLLMLLR